MQRIFFNISGSFSDKTRIPISSSDSRKWRVDWNIKGLKLSSNTTRNYSEVHAFQDNGHMANSDCKTLLALKQIFIWRLLDFEKIYIL